LASSSQPWNSQDVLASPAIIVFKTVVDTHVVATHVVATHVVATHVSVSRPSPCLPWL
jgi:hypothetical protein